MSKRKPHNHWKGYVFERKWGGSYLVVLDAANGGDWIDTIEKKRWIVVTEHANGAEINGSFSSLQKAREFVYGRIGK